MILVCSDSGVCESGVELVWVWVLVGGVDLGWAGFLAVSLSCDCCGFGFAGFVRFSVWVGAYRG